MQSLLQLRLAWRHLIAGRHLFTLPAILSVLGMALGVASLIMAMGVFSGYQKTLQQAIRGVTGDLVVVKSGGHLRVSDGVLDKVKSVVPDIVASSPFVQLEGMIAVNGVVSGAVLQGVDASTVNLVSDLPSRLRAGEFKLNNVSDNNIEASAMIGLGLSRKLKIKIGDQLKFILPVTSKSHATGFAPRVQTLRIVGLMDLGKYEFDERFILTDLTTAQKLAGYSNEVSGYRFRLANPDNAQKVQIQLNQTLGHPLWTRSWQQLNQNVMQAAALEKIVIFVVVSIMVIAASLNVAGHLYVSILRKFAEVSILRTMGARSSFISAIFSIHGLLVGLVGALLGVALGLVGVKIVEKMVRQYDLLPIEVYRISELQVVVSAREVLLILAVSALICYFATLIPARRGGRLSIIEGIRHE